MKAVPFFNEAVVLQEVALGSERAFTVLFRRYSSKVYSFALKLTRSEELAEEVVQDIFMKLWVNREKLGEVHEFGAYLNRVNRNHCLNVIKRLAQESKASAVLTRQNTEISYDTEHELAYRNTWEQIEEAINHLSPQQQKVYRLCHIDGLKHEEVALQLNISPGTVHTHMKRALKTIREHLQDAGSVILIAGLMEQFRK